MEITQSNLDLIFRQADMRFGQTLAATPVWNGQLASTVPVSTRQITYAWMARLPIMRKWVGERTVNAISTHQRTVTMDVFENTEALLADDVEDDTLGIFNMTLQFMAAQAAKWPDQQLAQFLRTANATLGYDGANVFSTSHPTAGGDVSGGPSGNQSNLFTSTALSYDNYVSVRTAMMAFKGEDGQPLTIVPDLLVVPPQLEGTAKLILEADFLANTAGTAPQSNVYKGTAKLLVIPELADKPNNWWMFDTSKPVKPLLWNLRQAPQFAYLVNPTDWNVFNTRQFLYGVQGRAAASESLWFLSAAATSAGSY